MNQFLVHTSTARSEPSMINSLSAFWNDDSGQGLTEYALILALVSIGLIVVLVIFRDAIGWVLDRIAGVLQKGSDAAQGYTPTT